MPYITFIAKRRTRLYVAYIRWLGRNIIKKETIKEKTYTSLLISAKIKQICTHCLVYYETPRDIFFGLYRDELLYIARRIK